MPDLQGTFSEIYKTGTKWKGKESKSGRGSDMATTTHVREMLPELVKSMKITSILDAGCGDWNWMQHVEFPKSVTYIGMDIVPEVIHANEDKFPGVDFRIGNVAEDPLPYVQLILCRHVLFHLSLANVWKALANFKSSGAEWLLTTTYPDYDKDFVDIPDGRWHKLNLEKFPFLLPKPYLLLPETEGLEGQLALFKLSEIIPSVRDTLLEKTAFIHTAMSSEEKLALYDLAREVPEGGNILEIGCLYGGSTAILGLGAPKAHIQTIDQFTYAPHGPSSAEIVYSNLNQAGVTNVTIRQENSNKAVHDGSKIDLLWIDGGHDYETALHDLMTFGPYAKVIAMHDFTNASLPGVRKAYDKFHKTYVQRNVKLVVHYLAVIRKDEV